MKKNIVRLILVLAILGTVSLTAAQSSGTISQQTDEELFDRQQMKDYFHLSLNSGTQAASLPVMMTMDSSGEWLNDMITRRSTCLSYTGNDLEADKNISQEQGTATNRPVKKKKLGRAILYNASVWLIDSVRYWSEYTAWIEDWQFELKWEDQKIRFTSFEANRFDSNPFITNWTHGVSGAIYYTFARYHRLSPIECLLFEMSSSFWWEYVTEWREVISVNDNFFSGVGGLPIGESFFRLSMLLRGKKSIASKALGTLCNPLISLCDMFGGKKWRNNFNDLENARSYFQLYGGNKQVSYTGDAPQPGNLFTIGMESAIYTIPGYGEPSDKKVSLFLKDTLVSEIDLDITFGIRGAEEFSLYTQAIILGHFSQHLRDHKAGGMSGYSLFLGAGSAFDLFKKKAVVYYDESQYHFDFTGGEQAELPTKFTDKLAIINLVGPVFDLSLYSGSLKYHMKLGAYFDFALVNSLALNKYSEDHDIYNPRKKTTLIHYGYYYAFGYTLAAQAQLSFGNLESGGKCKYQSYNSIEGLDRFQDEVVDDINVTDSRWMYKIFLGYRIPRSPLKIVLAYETIDRHGQLENVTQIEKEKRFYTQVRLSF